MTVYAVVKSGVVTEVIKPVKDDKGNEIPLALRYTADFIRTLNASDNSGVAVGWSYSGGGFVAPAAIAPEKMLQLAMQHQLEQISNACAATISAGFVSNALGSPHTYPAKATDQANISSSVMSAFLARMGGVWQSRTTYAVEDTIVANGIVYRCASKGVSGDTLPAFPPVLGQMVRDGLVQWDVWATPFWCADINGKWSFVPHTSPQMQRVGTDAKQAVLSNMVQNATLAAQVLASTTVAQVQAVNWP